MTRWLMVATTAALSVMLAACGGAERQRAADDASSVAPIVELSVPAAPAGRCMVPSVESLQVQDFAFEGVVSEIVDGVATVDVLQTYEGDDAETVRIAVPDPDLRDLVLAVDLEVQGSYLISSLEGEVSVCGLSGPKDGPLTELYEQAYRG